MKKKSVQYNKSKITVALMLTVLIIYAGSLIFMYGWGFITSLKSNSDFRGNPFGLPRGFPWNWKWSNYSQAFKNLSVPIYDNGVRRTANMLEMTFNSMFYSLLGPIITLSVTWITAYMLASFDRPFSRFIYRMNIVLMMIPIIGSLPSALQLYTALGLYNTWWYIAVSSITFLGSNLLIFHAYIKTIGNALREAAEIDGANNFSIMTKIFFPLTSKMFGILFIIAFISKWNDYMTMVIWLPSKPTLAFGMYKQGTTAETSASWPPMQFAGCMLLAIPIFALFLVFKDKIIGQVTMGALKG